MISSAVMSSYRVAELLEYIRVRVPCCDCPRERTDYRVAFIVVGVIEEHYEHRVPEFLLVCSVATQFRFVPDSAPLSREFAGFVVRLQLSAP